eukprot:5488159-Amphidinium_carterae.1
MLLGAVSSEAKFCQVVPRGLIHRDDDSIAYCLLVSAELPVDVGDEIRDLSESDGSFVRIVMQWHAGQTQKDEWGRQRTPGYAMMPRSILNFGFCEDGFVHRCMLSS